MIRFLNSSRWGRKRHGVHVWCQQKGSRVSHGKPLLVRDRFENYRYKWRMALFQLAPLFAARTPFQFPVAYQLSPRNCGVPVPGSIT